MDIGERERRKVGELLQMLQCYPYALLKCLVFGYLFY